MQRHSDIVLRPDEKSLAIDAKPSVLVVTPWFPNSPDGAYAAYMYESAASLARLGMAVTVLVCRPMYPAFLSRFAPEWVRGKVDTGAFRDLHQVRVGRYLALPGGHLRQVTNYLQTSHIKPLLRKLARQTQAALIHAQTEGMAPLALEVGKDLGIPIIATIHGLNTDPLYLHSEQQKALLAPALRGLTRLVLVGEPLRTTFAQYAGREDHIRIVPNGVHLPSAERQIAVLQRPVVRLMSTSNLHEGKGIDVALDALSLLIQRGISNWHYTIIGDGIERRSLEAKVQVLGLHQRVSFRGGVTREGVYKALLDSDVFVLPSYREAFGIAYLEAMACGLPTIGIRGQGPEAFIEHGISGYLVEPRNPVAIADCLTNLFKRPGEAAQVGASAKKRAQEFSWDRHGRRLSDVYAEVLRS